MEQIPSSPQERLRRYAREDVETLYRELRVTPAGLSREQIPRIREKYGENRIGYRTEEGPGARLRRAFITPFSVILLVLAAVSFVTDVWLDSNFSRNGTTVALILLMLVAGGAVRLLQERRAGSAADRLIGERAITVSVRRGGQVLRIPAEELVVGDVVLLSTGDRVPADLRLTGVHGLFVSQSLLTGESTVLEKTVYPLPPGGSAALSACSNLAFTGSSVLSGSGEGVVLAVGPHTVYGSYLRELQETRRSFDQGANSIAWVLIRFMATLVPVVFVISALTRGDWGTSFLFALSVAVGLTPEMLPVVINACLARGSAAMGRKQTIVKNINAMQSFGSMDVLCVDKTGTLTGDEIHLEYYLDILGEESGTVLDCAYLNSLCHGGPSNHLDRAILACSGMPGREAHFQALGQRVRKWDELPFDYTRKCASVLLSDGEGEPFMITKGAVEQVYARCRRVFHRGETVEIDPADAGGVHTVVDEMLEDGMKVLAVAGRRLPGKQKLCPEDERELTLLGYLVFFDAPKRSAAQALGRLRELHVRVKVLTGDHRSVAGSVCRRLGIPAEQILTGEALMALTEDARITAVEQTDVFAELTPGQKSELIRLLRENGHTVGFLGDGMNDLAAMTSADVGISVDTAAPAAKEAADVILLKKDLNVLEQGILEGRRAFANMSKYIHITASSNFGNIFSIVLASAFLPFLPMTSIQLLLLNLLYDLLCMTLPWDRVDGEDCGRPSIWSGHTLGRFMRFFGPVSSLFDLLTFAFLYWVLCPSLLGGGYAALSGAMQEQYAMLFHTGWFLESMWTQVLILHMLRTRHIPFVQSRASGVVWLVTSGGLLALTAVVYTPAAAWLGLTPLPGVYFLFLAGMVLCYMLLVTLAKRYYLRRYHTLW